MPPLFRKKVSLYVFIKTQKNQVHISYREWKGMYEMQEYLKIKWEVMELQVFCKYSFDSPLLHNKCLPIFTKLQLLPDIVFRR